jgi:protein phosphatase
VAVQSSCPHCKTPCRIDESRLGAPVRCPQCSRQFLVALPSVGVEPPGPRTRCRLELAAATSIGRVRKQNEDSYLIQHLAWSNQDQPHELALLVVADGVGGEKAGEEASGLAIRVFGQTFAPLFAGALAGQFQDTSATNLAETVDYAFQEANRAVLRKAQSVRACKGMASTGVAVLIHDDQAHIGQIGDCRVYHVHHDTVTQVTEDQTLVNRMVQLGQLTAEEALRHPARHEVTQAIGLRGALEPARHQLTLDLGDWLILSCDGLHSQLTADELEDTLSLGAASAGQFASNLVALAVEAGGKDNVTVVAVRCY